MPEFFEYVRPRLFEQAPPNVRPLAPSVAITTRFLRWWWSYRVETWILAGVYVVCVVLTTMLGPNRASLLVEGCVVLVIGCPQLRWPVRGVFTRARIRRRFMLACRHARLANHNDRVPTPVRIRSVPAGQVLRVRMAAGTHAGALQDAAPAIASFLEVREVRVAQDRDNARYADVTVVRRDPLSGATPLPWPHLPSARKEEAR